MKVGPNILTAFLPTEYSSAVYKISTPTKTSDHKTVSFSGIAAWISSAGCSGAGSKIACVIMRKTLARTNRANTRLRQFAGQHSRLLLFLIERHTHPFWFIELGALKSSYVCLVLQIHQRSFRRSSVAHIPESPYREHSARPVILQRSTLLHIIILSSKCLSYTWRFSVVDSTFVFFILTIKNDNFFK